MWGWAAVALLAFLPQPQSPPAVRITAIELERVAPNPNLLTNGGFEQLDERPFPSGWGWDKRNTDATCTVDESVVHSGKRSVRITNGTPFGPHIYGMLWRLEGVQVVPGKPYTFSAWFRSQSPGILSMICGHDWQFRTQAPTTGSEWRRVSVTFTPGEGDRDLVVRFGTESQTRGLWIDDVKLEEGSEATPFASDAGEAPAFDLAPATPHADIDGDGPFRVSYLAQGPGGPATLTATLDGSGVKRTQQLEPGFWRVTVLGEARGASDKPRELVLEANVGGTRLVDRAPVTFYSSEGALARIAAIEKRLPGLHAQLAAARKRKVDVAYPLVTLTVLDNFVRYAREDVEHETRRAIQQLGDMERMAARLAAQLKAGGPFPKVPQRAASVRPKVQGGSFLAPVRRPDGKIVQDWPVFFNGYGHFGRVVDDMEKWPAYGCNIIQIEFGPNSVFPQDGETNTEPMKRMLGVLDRAQKAGVMVCLLVSPHYMPDWAYQRWPQLRKRREGFLNYCIHAPEGRDLLQRFLHIAIEPLKNHPALHSICLSNEPVNAEEPCEYATASWHAWLAKTHGDVAGLNKRWGTSHASFDAIPLPNPFGGRTPSPAWMDYIRFNQDEFAAWHTMLADAVHAVAPNLPVHAKAMTWTMNEPSNVHYGVDPYLFGKFSQINGNDSANMHVFGQEYSAQAQGWEGNAISHDLQKSVNPGPVFNTENHIIADRDTRWVPAQHVRTALWQAAIHGQGATTVWVWERTFDRKSDFAGSIMHRPECAEAVGLVNYDLNRAAREVTAIQRAPFDAVILQSVTSLVWDGGAATDCAQKLYLALTYNGLKAGFVTERQLEDGIVPAARVVLVPSMRHLSRRALAALAKLKSRLVYVGSDVLAHDEYDAAATPPTPARTLRYIYGKTGFAEFQDALPSLLAGFRVASPVTVREVGRSGHLGVTLVETRCGTLDGARIVDIVNYRNQPVTVSVTDKSGPVAGVDILTGKPVSGRLTLAPLEFRLLRVGGMRAPH